MKRQDRNLDPLLDETIRGIVEEQADPGTVDDAAARVWGRVARESAARSAETRAPIRSCDDFQALIPAYVSAGLSEARALLLEDHVRDCVPCRKSLKQARSKRPGAAAPRVTPRSARTLLGREWSWVAVAAVLVAVALFGINIDFLGIRAGGMVTIKEVDGSLLRVTEEGTVPVSAGEVVRLDLERDRIRTARGSTALIELADGSRVEMNERTQLAVQERRARFGGERTDSTILLDRGNVIVEAADQGDGRLYVDTDDCRVEVTGTVFAVSHGLQGSRVSVVEGEVRVDRLPDETVLGPGGQVTTSANLARVPVDQEIAWSRHVDRHLTLLHELTRLGRELERVVSPVGLRHSTRLLDRVPPETVVYAAIPNFSGQLDEAYRHVRGKVDGNPILREWWQESMVSSGADVEMDRAFERVRDYGEHFGEEIVLAVPAGAREVQEPLILTELTRPAEFRDFLAAELLELTAATADAPNLIILEGVPPAPTLETRPERKDRFHFWIHDGLFAASPDRGRLEALAAGIARPESNPFTASPFHARLAAAYRDGVQWMLAVDLERVIGLGEDGGSDRDSLEAMGLLDLRHLIVTRREQAGRADTRATLNFDGPRRGFASWLGEPAPMGALDFISPDASLAAAFIVKRPSLLVDELLSFVGSTDDDFAVSLAEFEREHGVSIREDFAEPLGGEFAFAFDGPLLPKPSWKIVIEVYDPARLQRSLEWSVERLNEAATEHGKQGFRREVEERGGTVYHAIRSLDTGLAAHYVIVDGYLVAGPSRALLERALDGRRSGRVLARWPRFTALLPQDTRVDFSAVAYQNLGHVLGPFARQLQSFSQSLDAVQLQMLESIARDSSASLAFAYGEPERITVAATSEQGFFASGISLLSLQSLMDLQGSLEQLSRYESTAPQSGP